VQPALEIIAPEAKASSPGAPEPGYVLTVDRRPGVELTLPIRDGGDASSPLDVPAFLRRQS